MTTASNAFTEAIQKRIRDNSVVSDETGEYQGRDAIVTGDRVPGGATYPAVQIRGPLSNNHSGTKTTDGREASYRVVVWDDRRESTKRAQKIADNIKNDFHDNPITISGFHDSYITQADGSAIGPKLEEFTSRVVTITFTAQEK